MCVSAAKIPRPVVWIDLSPFAWIDLQLFARIGPRPYAGIVCSRIYRMISSLVALISSPFEISLLVVPHI